MSSRMSRGSTSANWFDEIMTSLDLLESLAPLESLELLDLIELARIPRTPRIPRTASTSENLSVPWICMHPLEVLVYLNFAKYPLEMLCNT